MRAHLGQPPRFVRPNRSGAALVTVLCIILLVGSITAMLIARAATHLAQTRALVRLEQAFYLAEAGAERAVAYLADGGAVPATLSAPLGEGVFSATILIEGNFGGGVVGSLRGSLNINPNNSLDNIFFAELPGGDVITRADLHENRPDYEGPAVRVQIMPKGPGSQNTLFFNGAPYPIQNNTTYAFHSASMIVRIYNDRRNPQGRAVGQWWIEFDAANATASNSDSGAAIRRDTYFTVHSIGRIGNVRRTVTIRGLHTVSWAKYALWYENEATTLWIVGGEKFHGPVYSRPRMRFHSWKVAEEGQARFFDRALTAQPAIDLQNNSVQPIFDRGLTLNAPTQSMISIDFDQLRAEASLLLTGATHITISSNQLLITNARRNWNRHPIPLPDDGLVYVRTATTGATATRPADVFLGAPGGLAGRLTLVAERDIIFTNHVRYARNPIQDEASADAMGLIAGRHAVVATNAPKNLEIFAHIICREGGFGVAEYDNPAYGDRGMLLVYGGIVNKTRNAVGTFGSGVQTGYRKNYVYDPRFRKAPPPRYPSIPDEFKWLGWDG